MSLYVLGYKIKNCLLISNRRGNGSPILYEQIGQPLIVDISGVL